MDIGLNLTKMGYNELKRRIATGDDWISNPMVLAFWYPGGGHAVVPYKIVESVDKKTGTVFVYDNNHPDESDRKVIFDLVSGITRSSDYNGNNPLTDVRAFQFSSFYRNDYEMAIVDSVASLGTSYQVGSLLYTDEIGRHLGYYNGEFKDEIPRTSPIIPMGQNEDNQFSETYYISDLNLKRELHGLDNGMASVSIFRPTSLITADVQVSPNSVDELRVPPDGTSVEFISGKGTQSLNLMLDRENTGFERIIRITGSEFESGNGVQLLLSDDLNKVGIINKGLPHSYNFNIEQNGLNPSSYNSLRPVTVNENSAVWITPLDWNDIDNTPIKIEYDEGNDGIIESIEILDNIAPTTDFAFSGTIGNNNWYRSNVQVNLTATDNAGGSGINKTEYSFDNATWITYSANFTVTTEGTTTFYYRSADNAGNIEPTKNKTIKIDKTAPLIDLVTIYPGNTTAGSTINITVSSSDNLGVVELTANGGASFINKSGVWEGSIIAAPAVGTYGVVLRAKDAAGNEAQKTVKYSVVYRSGGVSITSTPKPLSIVQGFSGLLNVKLMSTANIDDTVEVTINTTGLSAKSAWFNRTYVSVQVPAGKTILVPFSVTIPAGTASGLKTFKDYAKSRGFNLTSSDAGIVNVKP